MFPLVAPFGALIIGPIGLLYFALGADKNDYSGDGSLPFSLALGGLVVGAVGSASFGTVATLLGVNPVIAFPAAFYVTVAVSAAYISNGR
jgi:hypothetical protein